MFYLPLQTHTIFSADCKTFIVNIVMWQKYCIKFVRQIFNIKQNRKDVKFICELRPLMSHTKLSESRKCTREKNWKYALMYSNSSPVVAHQSASKGQMLRHQKLPWILPVQTEQLTGLLLGSSWAKNESLKYCVQGLWPVWMYRGAPVCSAIS